MEKYTHFGGKYTSKVYWLKVETMYTFFHYIMVETMYTY